MLVEVWSDVVCPWCYLGKRHLEAALAAFPHAAETTVAWRSFELDPRAPSRIEGSLQELIARKYGMTAEQAAAGNARLTSLAAQVGLRYRLDDVKVGNSFDAHRLIHLAGTYGLAPVAKERFLAAYFTEGAAIGDHEVLARLAGDVGLDSSEVRSVLDGDAFAEDVRADERRAGELGISGVPFFVVDGRWGISGAQPPDTILRVLDQAWADLGSGAGQGSEAGGSGAGTSGTDPADATGAEGGDACDTGSCAV